MNLKITLLIFTFYFCFYNPLIGQSQLENIKNIYQANTFNGGQIIKTAFDNSNNNITIGYANGSFSYDSETITTIGNDDMFFYKNHNETGEKAWSKVINAGPKGAIHPSYLKISKNDEIYIFANFEGTINLGTSTFISTNSFNGIILKFDSQGNFLWGTKLLRERLNSIQCLDIALSANNIFLLTDRDKVYNINTQDGVIINSRNFTGLSLSSIETNGRDIFIGSQPINENLLLPTCSILKVDPTTLQTVSFFKISGKTGNSVYDLNDLYYKDNAIFFNIKVVNDNSVIIKNANNIETEISSGTSSYVYVLVAKIDDDLINVNWNKFISNLDFSVLSTKFYEKNSNQINLYIDSYQNINIAYPQYGNINADKSVLLPIDANSGNLISNESFFSPHSASVGTALDYKFLNDKEYLATNYNDFKLFNRENSSNNYSQILNKNKVSNPGKIIGAFLKSRNNGDTYHAANYTQNANYRMGNTLPLNTDSNNIILSKINNTKVEEYRIIGKNFFILSPFTHKNKIDLNNENEFLSVFNCYQGSCTIIDANQTETKSPQNSETLAKFDANGRLQWSKFFEIIEGGINFISPFYDNDGNIVVTISGVGSFSFNGNTYTLMESTSYPYIKTFYIFKFDKTGNLIFTKAFSNDIYYSTLSFDNDNNIYFFVTVHPPKWEDSSPVFFDYQSIDIHGKPAFLMVKMLPNGEVTLVKKLDSDNNTADIYASWPMQTPMAKFDGTNFIVSGGSNSTVTFTGESIGKNFSNLLNKVSPNGDILWSKPLNSPNNFEFDIDELGKIYYLVNVNDKLKVTNAEFALNENYNDVLLKFDTNGNFLNYTKISELNPEKDKSYVQTSSHISVLNSKKMSISTNTSLNSIWGHEIYNTNGNNYVIINVDESNLNVKQIKNKTFQVYPNPTSEILHLKSDDKIIEIEVFDMSGKLVLVRHTPNEINVSSLKKGVYIIKIITSKETITSKFIKK